ncbi:hypothetical protein HOC35_02925 [Candidatus Woesearchaeota archaeon]|jgi:hypothetical protein|nr:hypothetical protein [Candidatus Woesearchaeota archaeon]
MQEEYLIKHLTSYVKFEVEQGYDLEDIKTALFKYGYKKQLVDHVVSNLGNLKPEHKQISTKKDMTEEMYFYIQNMLVDYMQKQLKNGYSTSAIKSALLRSGHHKDMIDKAIKLIKEGKVVDYDHPITTVFPSGLVLLFSIFVLSVFVLFMGMSTDHSLVKIIMTMMPAYFSLVVTFFVISSKPISLLLRMMPFLSVAITVVAYVLMLNYTLIFVGTDMTILLGLNVVSSFLLNGLMCVLAQKPKA